MNQTKFQTALITGASSGIGAELSRQLAPMCERLIIVARRENRLESLAKEISERLPMCQVFVEKLDLADEKARIEFSNKIKARSLVPDLLVNNAGLGDHGEIATADWERLRRVVEVNVLSLLHLTHLFLPEMISARRGLVVNISSIASLIPLPEIGVYAATKAFVTSFSEALRIELAGKGVEVTAICPGPIRTEFGEVAMRPDVGEPIRNPSFMMMPLESAVREMVGALTKRKPRYIPGVIPRLVMMIATTLPLPMLRAVLGLGYRARRRNVR